MPKMPYWATDMSIKQLATYLPPANTLPSVMPIHMYDRTEYDEVEVHPCTQDENGCEQCEPDDPELAMWSCFLHCKVGGIECVADFANEKEADAYAQFLRVWLRHNAGACILAHNHPSGIVTASRADELLTQMLKSALSLVDVRVVDHIIVAENCSLSFVEKGLM